MDIKDAIRSVIESKDLSEDDAFHVASEIMSGKVTDAQMGALLIALRLKGETINEITGFVKAMRQKATQISSCHKDLVDTCGTGGDRCGTFNISTISALVAAGAECKVAKHGNRSVSSQCGSADLLSELGVRIDVSPDKIASCIDGNGIGFLFAPSLHNAMKYAIGPRKEIGVRTIFNILGPLTNPAGTRRQLLGVFKAELTEPIANVLKKLGSVHVLVVHGEDGLDEITLSGKTRVSELNDGDIRNYYLEPENFGLKRVPLSKIQGGVPSENARITIEILNGEKGPRRDVILINAGAVIYVSGKASSIKEGMGLAAEAIDSGKALQKLDTLRQMSR